MKGIREMYMDTRYDSFKCMYCGKRIYFEVKEAEINKYYLNNCCSQCFRKIDIWGFLKIENKKNKS